MTAPGVHAFVRRWWGGELGAVGVLLHGAFMPAELAYRTAVNVRNRGYDVGLRGVHRVGIGVISIGNIAVGGTGKTPFAHWIAREMRRRGHRPAILHGGYADDEPELHRRWSPDIPVIVNRDRVEGARTAERAGATVVVLDDGFQHRRLHRDLDIVLVASERGTLPVHLLPRGPWREPLTALQRADVIVVTRKRSTPAEAERVATSLEARTGRPMARAQLQAFDWRDGTGARRTPDRAAIVVAALAEPGIFVDDVRAAGADVADVMTFPDHHAYTAADAASVVERAGNGIIVTSEKDWTRLDRLLDPERVRLLQQRVIIESGGALLERVQDAVPA